MTGWFSRPMLAAGSKGGVGLATAFPNPCRMHPGRKHPRVAGMHMGAGLATAFPNPCGMHPGRKHPKVAGVHMGAGWLLLPQ